MKKTKTLFLKRILEKIIKKLIVGTNNTWFVDHQKMECHNKSLANQGIDRKLLLNQILPNIKFGIN